MYYEVYLDVVFLINLILDFVLLKITGSIVKRKSTLFRCFFAAFLGSVMLCAIIVFNSDFLSKHPLVMLVICNFIITFVAYYQKKEKLYKIAGITLIFFAVSFLLGGILNAIYGYTVVGYYHGILNNTAKENAAVPWQLVCFGALVCCFIGKPVILSVQKIKATRSIYWEAIICIDGYEKSITALVDTGNRLYEPISGKPVHVLEMDALAGILNGEFKAAVKKMYDTGIMEDGLYRKNGIRMIPFRAVGTPNEKLLVGICADRIRLKNHTIEYQIEKPYVALYDGKLAGDGSYHMLLHGGDMMRRK